MAKVEDVKVLNIDGTPYAVDSMSEQVKQLVAIYNEWNQDEADARSRLMQITAAKNDLSRQIIMTVRQEKEAAEAAAAEGTGDGTAATGTGDGTAANEEPATE